MANPLGRKILEAVKPARYIGEEYGAYSKPWEGMRLRWCLAFPDIYEIGMSHLGLKILYHVLNEQNNILADRVFAPYFDMERLLTRRGVPLWGLESGRPLMEFDVLGITIPYELTYTNILSILRLGGISLLSKERGRDEPIVIGGGCGAFNPEPVADFFDAILLGDGEDAVLSISEKIMKAKEARLSRGEIIDSLSEIGSLYIPGMGTNRRVRRDVMPDLDKAPFPERLLVPNIGLVHDRVSVEIQRGCSRGCRFCQAGMIYRPNRQRSAEEVIRLAEENIKYTGIEECAFLSLSASDYKSLPEIVGTLSKRFRDKWIHISLPSLRTEGITREIGEILSRSLKGGFTLAPEAGTERLREIINKGNREDDLLASVDRIFSLGWRNLKLYFMIGLPGETDEDIEAIPSLARKVLNIGRKYHRHPGVTINVSTFVPKPHTPFQWERQITIEETKRIHGKLRKAIRDREINLKLHSPEMSFLEGVFSRGERSLARLIIKAYEKGIRFDAWEDEFRFGTWMGLFREEGVDPNRYLRERSESDPLPWGHLFTELDKGFLREERRRARELKATPDCSMGDCSRCGICDGKALRPRLVEAACSTVREAGFGKRNDKISAVRYRVRFAKAGPAIFVGQVDLTNLLRRAFRRAGLAMCYSHGFSPRPRFSFAHPLPLGVASLDEWFDVELARRYDPEEIKSALAGVFTCGIEITGVAEVDCKGRSIASLIKSSRYIIESNAFATDTTDIRSRVSEFNNARSIILSKNTKSGHKKIDLRPLVIDLAQIASHAIEVELSTGSASILDVAGFFFGIDIEHARSLKIEKIKSCLMS